MDENSKICISFARLPSRRIENSCTVEVKRKNRCLSEATRKDTDCETEKDRERVREREREKIGWWSQIANQNILVSPSFP